MAILDRLAGKNLTEKVPFKQNPERSKGMSHAHSWERIFNTERTASAMALRWK